MSIEIFPVVHIVHREEALEQSVAAYEAGADGVYLINHNVRGARDLFDTFNSVVEQCPDHFVGINILQLDAFTSFDFLRVALEKDIISRLPNGLWADDALPDKESIKEMRDADPLLKAIRYLGGAAFKYTSTYTDNPAEAAFRALEISRYVDVVTTSGKGTGHSPSVEKIAAMKQVIGTQPLAVASGISAENISDFYGWFDELLVASSIETKPGSGIFDMPKLHEIIQLAHQAS